MFQVAAACGTADYGLFVYLRHRDANNYEQLIISKLHVSNLFWLFINGMLQFRRRNGKYSVDLSTKVFWAIYINKKQLFAVRKKICCEANLRKREIPKK